MLTTTPSTTRSKNGRTGLPGWGRADDMLDNVVKNFLRRPSDNTRIVENEDSYEWMIDMPGVGKDNIEVRLENDILHVETDYEDRHTRRSFANSVKLGGAVNAEDISASYEDGVLTVNMPKRDSSTTGREIEVT